MPGILVIWEAEIGRIIIPGQPGQISLQDPILTNGWVRWYMPVISAMEESIEQGGCSPGWPGQKARPYLKNNQRKKA
jgi:hypothetical protein